MAGQFPFAAKRGVRYGLAPRMTMAAFFENLGLNDELQEHYYRWWYDRARDFVQSDPDLRHTKAIEFSSYPYGQHARHGFHLNHKVWANAMADLGDFVRDLILPKLTTEQSDRLVQAHEQLLEELKAEARKNPRTPAPEIGYFRHN